MDKILKGEGFQNRYRITGRLKTVTPLHIGTGEEKEDRLPNHAVIKSKGDKKPSVSTVIKDARGKPIIPGSALKGVMRHWLFNVLSGSGDEWGATRNYQAEDLVNLSQEEQIAKVKAEFSWLEILFGTPFHEGKIEVWDATCLTTSLPPPDKLLNWDRDSLTYVDTSVAIDPQTGTAIEHLLYKTEVVPPGVEFEFTLTGQNLSQAEMGLILLALQGFNSAIYPLQVGARSGRGFGRFRFTSDHIYYLDSEGIHDWIKGAIGNFDAPLSTSDSVKPFEEAGHYALPKLSEVAQKQILTEIKNEMIALLGE